MKTKQERYAETVARIEKLEAKQAKRTEKIGKLRTKAQRLLNKINAEESK
jgi:hypothetical protein